VKVTFIGLGNMGAAMAGRIARAGHALVVWNRSAGKTAPLVAAGAQAAATPADAVRGAEVVVTSLMDDQSVLDMVIGPNGIAAAMAPGAVHLCVTTISPECADRLGTLHQQGGTRFVSGPVAGRPDSAAAGQLITFLGGDSEAIAAVTPVCSAYARRVVPLVGRPGLANSMKLCVNYTAVSIIELMGEIYTFGEKCGIDADVIKEFFLDAFAHPALKTYAHKLRDRKFTSEGGFALKAGLKDVRLMLQAASQAGVPFEIAKVVERKMLRAIDQGLGQSDWSGITAITRQEAGLG
jgi:3-hydroxyisobutyrate dehydrogenase-like beta-hydroxyacid dehydrogenase